MTTGSSRAVLIVEHDVLLKSLTSNIMVDAGFEALQAGDADEALAILESRSDIALMLTSVTMPGSMDGLGLARIPTFIEQGYPRLSATEWLGLLAPAGTPEPIIKKLNVAVNRAMQTPEAGASFQKLGVEAKAVSPQEFKSFMAAETQKWRQVVAEAGVKGE
jgi:CheY-like chemotaxis protein